MILVLLVLVVLSILSTAVFTLFTGNLNQSQTQEEAIRSHYIAMGGIDLAFGALLKNDRSLLKDHFDKDINMSVSPLEDTLYMDTGSVDIVVASYVEDNERWILITATGSVNDSTVKRVVKMHFRLEYPEIQRWE